MSEGNTGMTKQTWTAIVAAVAFVLSAAIVALVPVPYVVWAPGATHNLLGERDGLPVVQVSGVDTYATSGELLLTTVSQTKTDARVTLPEVLYAYWAPDRDVLPRTVIYPAGLTASDVAAREEKQMDNSQMESVAAAAQAAGLKVERVPMITSVATVGPAASKLMPGDFIIAVNDQPTATTRQVGLVIAKQKIGTPVSFTIERNRQRLDVNVEAVASRTQPGIPVVGINYELGYRTPVDVSFGVDPAIGGSSAGLMLSLAVYETITDGSLVAGRRIAGSGQIDGAGNVTAVGAVQEKIAAAEQAGAEVFVLSKQNCADLSNQPTKVRLVAVSTLAEAIASLEALNDPQRASSVQGCLR